MSVHKTPQGTYRVKYREGDRQRSKTFPTKAAADRYDAEVKRRQLEGKPVSRRQDAPILRDFTIEWLAGRTDLAPKTLETYTQAIDKHVLPQLGHLRIHGTEIRPGTLAHWQRERLADGAGPSSIRIARMVLSQILAAAVLPYELLDANPMASIKPPAEPAKEPRFLAAIAVERMRRRLIDQGNVGSATLISVLAYVGIRPQDALALEWKHVGKELTVIQKNTDGRIVPGSKTGQAYRRRVNIPEPVAADLEGWRIHQGKPTAGLIFPRAKDGMPWRRADYQNWRRRHFKATAADAGLGNLKPYDLRHTCGSLLAAAGWNHLEVAAQLGHSAETSVRVYQHLIRTGFGERKPIDDWITEAREQAGTEAEKKADGQATVPSEFPQEPF